MPLPTFKTFKKNVFNYEGKSQQAILAMLQLESAQLMEKNPGYQLEKFIGPLFRPDKSAVYYIKFKISASLIQ